MRLAIMSAPRGDSDLVPDLRAACAAGIRLVVSCLESAEVDQLGLEAEARVAESLGLGFLSVPIPDHSAPVDDERTQAAARAVAAALLRGVSVAVHCFAGRGRSPTLAAAALVATGLPLEEALGRISDARGRRVPERPEQVEWLKAFERSMRASG